MTLLHLIKQCERHATDHGNLSSHRHHKSNGKLELIIATAVGDGSQRNLVVGKSLSLQVGACLQFNYQIVAGWSKASQSVRIPSSSEHRICSISDNGVAKASITFCHTIHVNKDQMKSTIMNARVSG
jgi:hypothetical protein